MTSGLGRDGRQGKLFDWSTSGRRGWCAVKRTEGLDRGGSVGCWQGEAGRGQVSYSQRIWTLFQGSGALWKFLWGKGWCQMCVLGGLPISWGGGWMRVCQRLETAQKIQVSGDNGTKLG